MKQFPYGTRQHDNGPDLLENHEQPNKLASAPSLNESLGSLGIILTLSVTLAGRKEFAAICIKNAIESNVPCETILMTVKDMCVDNTENMTTILGKSLVDKILSL